MTDAPLKQTFIWNYEGEPGVGEIEHYGKAYVSAYYGGDYLSREVYVWDAPDTVPRKIPVQVEVTPFNEDLYATHIIRIGDETTHVTIDGRA